LISDIFLKLKEINEVASKLENTAIDYPKVQRNYKIFSVESSVASEPHANDSLKFESWTLHNFVGRY
jgi:hypothetical protein